MIAISSCWQKYVSQLHPVSWGVWATPELPGRLIISLGLETKDFEVPAIPNHMIEYYSISFDQMRNSLSKGKTTPRIFLSMWYV